MRLSLKSVKTKTNKASDVLSKVLRNKLAINIVPKYPRAVYIEVTNKCNLKCTMCPRCHLNRKIDDMDYELFKKCIDEISRFNPKPSVQLAFLGEPLVNKKIISLIEYSKKNGLNTSLISNGLLLTKEIADAFIQVKLDSITFSIDAVTKETYDKIRINSDFGQVHNNIEYLIERKNKLGVKLPAIQTSMVIQEANKAEYEDFIDKWIDKTHQVYFQRVFYDAEGNQGRQMFYRDVFSLDLEKRKPCYYLWELVVVYCDGKVTVCPPDDFGLLVMGDISKQSLYDIWHSKQYNELRLRHLKNDLRNKKLCASCDYWRGYILKDKEINFKGRKLIKSENPLCISYRKR